MASNQGYPIEKLEELQDLFDKDDKSRLAQKAFRNGPFLDVLYDNQTTLSHRFNTKTTPEIKPITDQKASGRCWIYACLNAIRVKFCQAHDCEEFEFSQTHVFFWDKVERCAFSLSSILRLLKQGKTVEDRKLFHLLQSPTDDGGQYQMLVNLIEKHGLIPNECWPSPWMANNSLPFRRLLNNQIREFASKAGDMVQANASDSELETLKEETFAKLYKVIVSILGSPPKQVEADVYDKNKAYKNFGPCSPLEFYREHVKPHFSMGEKICLTHDPRPNSEYYKLYTVEFLNNMENAEAVKYVNLPIDRLKHYARVSIEDNEAVWFGCDVGKEFHNSTSSNVLDQFCYKLALDVNIRGMSKAQRLSHSESAMTHAMLLVGCQVEGEGEQKKVTKWRVENSWGSESRGAGKGYLVMDDAWFDEYVLEIAIDRSRLSEDILEVLKQEPTVLPPWDPMGSLAQ